MHAAIFTFTFDAGTPSFPEGGTDPVAVCVTLSTVSTVATPVTIAVASQDGTAGTFPCPSNSIA